MFKKIIIIITLLSIGGILTLAAASGIIKVPFLSPLLGADKPRNLIGEVDLNLYKDALIKGEVTLTDEVNKYCLTCDISYKDFSPMDITLSSAELSSLLQATNNDLGPLKEIQVKLNDNNQAEMSAYLNLKDYGYDFSGPVYAAGSIAKSDSSNLAIKIQRVEVGILSIPEKYIKQGEDSLNILVNSQLAKMPDLKIDLLEISDSSLRFKGNYPKTASVK
ncbi:MAG: hypothetical protein KAQ64_01190 [Candidatus Pacebacteria bacterium]|nr:hypothetical protein [Candidatus Paceibacterota bacterium]